MTLDPYVYLEAMSTLEDVEIDLGAGALALAAVQHPGISIARYEHHFRALAERLGRHYDALIAAGADDDAGVRLAALKYVLHEQEAYRLDARGRDDIRNADIIEAIERTKGGDIALAILYVHTARLLGWDVDVLDIAGRFVLRLTHAGQRQIFDHTQGCAPMAAPELRALIKARRGDHAELSADYFEPLCNRAILLALQNEVKFKQIEIEDYDGALSSVEMLRLIDPREYRLLLEEGILRAKKQQYDTAISCLEDYIEQAPDSRDQAEAYMLLQELLDSHTDK